MACTCVHAANVGMTHRNIRKYDSARMADRPYTRLSKLDLHFLLGDMLLPEVFYQSIHVVVNYKQTIHSCVMLYRLVFLILECNIPTCLFSSSHEIA